MFLPIFVGCCHRGVGHILFTGGLGKMGHYHSRRAPGHHEPLLQDVLLQSEKRSSIETILQPTLDVGGELFFFLISQPKAS